MYTYKYNMNITYKYDINMYLRATYLEYLYRGLV